MNHTDLARKVLMGAFPQECAAVGQSSVDDVLSGVEIVPPEEGHPFPIHDFLQFLKDVLQLVLALIPLIAALWDQLKRKPTLPEVKVKATKRRVKLDKLSAAQVDKAIEELLKDISRLDDLRD